MPHQASLPAAEPAERTAPAAYAGAPTATAPTLRVLIFMFDEMELLDFAGPFEVFTTAVRVAAKLRRQASLPPCTAPWTVETASAQGQPVRARAGLVLQAQHALEDAPAADVLLIPGGVVDGVLADAQQMAQLRAQAERAALVASVCTGAFILADAGLLHAAPCTTHWEDVEDLRQRHPHLQLQPQARWVDNGRIVTSAGISAGMDMSLHLVERLAGRELALATARQMDYAWRDA
jgi:transcriptional regulator GlxA family with amidase domain